MNSGDRMDRLDIEVGLLLFAYPIIFSISWVSFLIIQLFYFEISRELWTWLVFLTLLFESFLAKEKLENIFPLQF